MRIPVLIAARNEAEHIGDTLDRLPPSVEPIVIPNGCTDDGATIDIALSYVESHNVTVWESPVEGKLPSLQFAIHKLGKRAAEPLVTVDADTHPAFPSRWLPAMLAARAELDHDKPATVIGPWAYDGVGVATSAWRNLGLWRHLLKTRKETPIGAYGGNMLMDFQNDDVVEQVLSMRHFWPREDVALKDMILKNDGASKWLLNPAALVRTHGDRFPGLCLRMKLGHEASEHMVAESYLKEAAPGSVPYRGPEDLEPQTSLLATD